VYLKEKQTVTSRKPACLPLAQASCTLNLVFSMLIAMNDRLIIE